MKHLDADSSSTTLYCFSPPVMLATFIIEIISALYVLWRYKLNQTTRLAIAILISLATFQLAEYFVCEGALGISSLDWARVGFIAITLLPPLGIHLTLTIAKDFSKNKRRLLFFAYAAAAVFAIFFLFAAQGITSSVCLGNYVLFTSAPAASVLYGLYYYGLTICGTVLAAYLAKTSRTHKLRLPLYALSVGYLSFLIPTTTVNLLAPATVAGIPSIMCGFAVILALIVTLVVVPQTAAKR